MCCLIFRGGCAINCRYCFRRHFPYPDNHFNRQRLDEVITYLKQHPEVNEVILSGGDPLMAKDDAIARLLDSFRSLTADQTSAYSQPFTDYHSKPYHLQPWWNVLRAKPAGIIIVTHINHAQEIDAEVIASLLPLRKAQNITLAQSKRFTPRCQRHE